MANSSLAIKRIMFSMASLVDLGREVTASKNMAEQMRAALYVVTGMFSVPSAALYRYHPQRKVLELLAQKGQKEKGGDQPSLSLGTKDLQSFNPNTPHLLRDLQQHAFVVRNKAALARLNTAVLVPLFVQDDFVGALVLGKKLGRTRGYSRGDRELLCVIAHQLAVTLHNARLFMELSKKASENKRLYESMRRIYHDTIQAFSAAIDAKDEYTKDHSYRVATYAVAIARELGWKKKDVEGIYVAGLLHDIGKIIIDTRLIKKGEQLTAGEINEMKKHPQISYSILSKIRFPWKNIDHFVRHHHERPDGKGYPDSLVAPQLHEGEKILALADAFDAMTTDRPYRDRRGIAEACREVMRCSGTQFDQRITETFFRLLQRELSGEVKEPLIAPLLRNADAESIRSFTAVGAN